MKKWISLLLVVVFITASCSKSDETVVPSSEIPSTSIAEKPSIVPETPSTTTLIKKTEEYYYDRSVKYTFTTEFTYASGKKLESIARYDDNMENYEKMSFEYIVDKIYAIKFTDKNNKLIKEVVFGYKDNKLINVFEELEKKLVKSTTYTHNADGTISFEIINHVDFIKTTGTLFYSNGNLIKTEFLTPNKSIDLYTYDTKNHPTKNIVGIEQLLDYDIELFGKNNRIQFAFNFASQVLVDYTLTYNADGFPIKSIAKEASNDVITTEFTY